MLEKLRPLTVLLVAFWIELESWSVWVFGKRLEALLDILHE
jgi:hypothetical protein